MSNDPALAQDASAETPLTPCIGTCRLDDRGYCVGCQRSGEEIGRWRMMSNAERLHVMQQILPLRRQP
ncbi:putative Fe-S protein YdhL (DUF1289 family) [Rhodanobacter sp. TND4EL1]